MAGAEHVQLWRRLDGLHEHFHLPSADEAGFLREVVVQVELQLDRLAALDGLARLPERLVLVAAAADRPHRAAVRVDQHLCADALRRGSGRRDDGDERHLVAALEGVVEGGEDLLVH